MNEQSEHAGTAVAALITCHNCGQTVPQGEFCGACGAHLVPGSPASAHRRHAYAAHPGEAMLHFSVISTLLPHLPHRRSAPFQVALILTVALLLVLGLLRLTGPAIAAAAVAIPLLYLLYFYEIEVYGDEPVRVIGMTFGIGLLLGIPWALLTGPYVTQTLILDVSQKAGTGHVLVSAVLFPLLAQLLMLVGALILYVTRRFDEALDGFTFGVAGALGFALSTTVVNLWPELRTGLVSNAPVLSNTLDVLQRGLLIPLLYSCTTGLIAAALWLRRGRVRSVGDHGWTTLLFTSAVIAAVFLVALGTINVFISSAVLVVSAYTLVVAGLLLWVRVALHHMLLAEAVEVGIGPDGPCSHCGRIVPRMAFCPNCGIATRATPKTGSGRAGRLVR